MNCSKIKIVFIFIGLLFFSNVFAWQIIFSLSGQQYSKVDFFDVGQGDAIFIETPSKKQILIDGGPDSQILEKLGEEMSFYDRTIDLIILTHPEKDHLFGLIEVLKRYKIKNILWTGVVRDTAEWEEWNKLIKEENANIKIAKAGDRIILENPSIFFDVLNPIENEDGKEIEDSNDTSIILSLTIEKNKFLFTGDVSFKIEKQLLEENIDSDVLKVAHHGSRTSTSEQFLEKVSPLIAVISVGKNNYGHPTEELLARLDNFSIEVLRTDKNGDIKIFSNGENLKLITK